jgi:hypothetical protein
MSKYETRSGQFGLVGGSKQPASDMVLAVEPAGGFTPAARKGRLYVVAETAQDTARGREACQLACRTIRKQFYDDPSFSVTAALRKALLAANHALYQQNFGAPAAKRAYIGVTCAVVKGEDLYIAQIKPSQAYVLAEGKLRAIPAGANWRQGGTAYFKPNALGNSLTLEPEFFRAVLRPGDALLLTSSTLADVLDRETVTRLLRAAEPAAVAAGLVELCGEHEIGDAHGLSVGVYTALAPSRSAGGVGVGEATTLAIRGIGEQFARLSAQAGWLLRGAEARGAQRRATAARTRDRAEDERLNVPYEEPAFSPDPPPDPRPIDLGEAPHPLSSERAGRRWKVDTLQVRPPELRRLTPSSFLGEGGNPALPPLDRAIDLSDTPGMAALGRDARPGRATLPPDETPFGPRRTLLQRIGVAVNRQRRRRNQRSPQAVVRPRRQPGLSYRKQRTPFPWLLLLLLVSLVTVLVLYGTNLTRENAERVTDNTLVLAEQAVAAVRDAPDDATARERLATARAALADLQASGTVTATLENRRRFDELAREYERALAAVQKLTYFEDVELVAEHPVPGSAFDTVVVPPPPRGITNTVGFASLYLLDSNAGILYRTPRTGGTPQPFLRSDEVVAGSPLAVGRVRAQAWRYDNIVVVAQSADGGPFTYYFRNGENWAYSLLAGSEEWGRVSEPFRVANYEGNLYVWGVVPGNILRYQSGQFGQFPDPWVENPGGKQFESALDLAVDGKIYLLQPDGSVLVFAFNEATGERAFEREIAPPAVDPPLAAATRFFVSGESPEAGFIFLVDASNERVIQIDKVSGELIQQTRVRPESSYDLGQLNSIAVDEGAARPTLYLVMNAGQVLRATVPERPEPFRAEGTPTTTP